MLAVRPDPTSAAEAHARVRAIEARQEEMARRAAAAIAAQEMSEALAQTQGQLAALRAELRDALSENDALRERLHLYGGPVELSDTVPLEWGLRPQEAVLLIAIRRAGSFAMSVDQGLTALYPHDADMRSQGTVPVLVSRLRRKLEAANTRIVIETYERRGYRLSPDSIAVFDAAISGASAARHCRTLKRESERGSLSPTTLHGSDLAIPGVDHA